MSPFKLWKLELTDETLELCWLDEKLLPPAPNPPAWKLLLLDCWLKLLALNCWTTEGMMPWKTGPKFCGMRLLVLIAEEADVLWKNCWKDEVRPDKGDAIRLKALPSKLVCNELTKLVNWIKVLEAMLPN
ncbi:hypothetical protein GCM10010305_63110 [Streptomyces termitum]|uniref:Uncharacterized protein n=1 Tax=Streptomyces termitum TaxID=67368 RepID=A0A918WEF2_9ACTN|nr:hypothetical protein GCM10010305_63110 [Streptomyces termitum]